MIVASDLARVGGENGEVVVGPETKIACDMATKIARHSKTSLIVCTAGNAGKKWNHAWMGIIVGQYVVKQIDRDRFLAGKASRFNTSGEMKELARLARSERWENLHITLVVKWWHAPRAKFLCKLWLWRYFINAKVSVVKCESHVGWHIIAAEYLLAWPKNLLWAIIGR
jgi:hypothetical protein